MEGKVVVEIVDKDKKEGGNNKTATNTKTGDTKIEQEDDDALIISSALAYKAFRTTVSQVKTIATYEIDKSFTLSDDFESKRDFHIALSILEKAGNVATSTFVGAKLGSAGGPVGAIVGAVVGFVGSVGNEAISVYQAYNQQDITMKQRNEQLKYARQRAGFSLESGSIGENR